MLRSWCGLVVVATLVMHGTAQAVFPPPIRDDGKFFTKEGAEKANKKIREIYEKYKKDVVVETVSSLTAEQEKQMKDDGREKFFNRLAFERGREIGLNGVLLLIFRNPQHMRIHMDADTQKRVFHGRDRDRALQAIVGPFKQAKFDAGLMDGLETIEATLKANTK